MSLSADVKLQLSLAPLTPAQRETQFRPLQLPVSIARGPEFNSAPAANKPFVSLGLGLVVAAYV
jgi:hypothetical protein